MASLQELRKRLRSIRSIEQLAGAMRTAATVKYSRLGRVRDGFSPYASAGAELLRLLGTDGIARETETAQQRGCIIVFSGNRGLCGGFHTELFRFLEKTLVSMTPSPLLLVGGRRAAAWLRERGFSYEEFSVSDVPEYDEIRPIAARAMQLFISGEAGTVFVLFQHFCNMLTQEPMMLQFLPDADAEKPEAADGGELLFLPDRETVARQIAEFCLNARLYDLALECAAGAQAATLMSMRSACDNARTAAADLEVTINRRRQAEITSGVIETAAGAREAE